MLNKSNVPKAIAQDCINILQQTKVRRCVYDLRVSNSACCPNSLKVKPYMINSCVRSGLNKYVTVHLSMVLNCIKSWTVLISSVAFY